MQNKRIYKRTYISVPPPPKNGQLLKIPKSAGTPLIRMMAWSGVHGWHRGWSGTPLRRNKPRHDEQEFFWSSWAWIIKQKECQMMYFLILNSYLYTCPANMLREFCFSSWKIWSGWSIPLFSQPDNCCIYWDCKEKIGIDKPDGT